MHGPAFGGPVRVYTEGMRTKLVILLACVALIALGAYLLTQQEPEKRAAVHTGPVTWDVLAEGTSTAQTIDRKNYRLRNSEELASVWEIVHGPKAKPPVVDFDKHEVLAVFDGPHATNGYGIAVSRIADTEEGRVVTITHTAPEKGCEPKRVAFRPYQLVLVAPTQGALSHTDETVAIDCK
ncbi:MAG: hypothetical protein ABA06_04810 [Parcubacteria bacterium C7867-001]|nr:MAG: hypothetical protein ABA06_04810 [Parcubacteria bacterium C7867-001]